MDATGDAGADGNLVSHCRFPVLQTGLLWHKGPPCHLILANNGPPKIARLLFERIKPCTMPAARHRDHDHRSHILGPARYRCKVLRSRRRPAFGTFCAKSGTDICKSARSGHHVRMVVSARPVAFRVEPASSNSARNQRFQRVRGYRMSQVKRGRLSYQRSAIWFDS